MGFVSCTAIIILYIVMITRAINVAKTARDDLGSYIATGIVGILIFHVLENIGMTMGLLPITGVPLPFISYGGTSMVILLCEVGMVLNISSKIKLER